MNDILIGTSGYDYPEWKGVFYPENLKREEFLEFYATRFNALEINNTFYNMPDSMRMMKFLRRTEGRLQFSVKANRTLTHEITKDWKSRVEEMKLGVNPLLFNDALSSVLFQMPQSFHYTPENRFYLSDLIKEFEAYPVVIEFRHKEWIRESVFEGLAKRKVSVVFCDMPKLKALPDGTACGTPFIGPDAYLRMHGRNENAWYNPGNTPNGSGRYDYEYSQEELESFVPVILSAVQEKRRVQVYFNNHPGGSGAHNAGQFKQILKDVFKNEELETRPARPLTAVV